MFKAKQSQTDLHPTDKTSFSYLPVCVSQALSPQGLSEQTEGKESSRQRRKEESKWQDSEEEENVFALVLVERPGLRAWQHIPAVLEAGRTAINQQGQRVAESQM